MSHTKEPWFIRHCDDDYHQCMTVITNNPKWHGKGNIGLFNDESDTVAITYHQLSPVVGDIQNAGDNAKRIVACVNACAEIETHELELMTGDLSILKQISYKPVEKLTPKAFEYRQERDKLIIKLINAELALQQIATGSISGEENNFKDTVSVMRNIAKEAIKEITPS